MDIETVKQIHQTKYQFFIAATGGGQSFLGEFTKIEGASTNFIGGIVPYNQKMFDEFIGGKSPDSYVSSVAARRLATASYCKCLSFGVEKTLAIGIGVSSSLAKSNERVGRQHKSFIAVHTYFGTTIVEIVLTQYIRTRLEEEELICNIILDVLANKCNIKPISTASIFGINIENGEIFNIRTESDINLRYLINNETDLISSKNLAQLPNIVIFSGSFNPLHDGHKLIIKVAKEVTNNEVFLELSVDNTDKGFIDFIELEDRIKGFDGFEFILTNAPTVKSKIDVIRKYAPLAEITVVVGADTWDRIWDVKYGFELDFLEKFFSDNKVKFIILNRGGYIRKQFVWGKNLEISHKLIDEFQPLSISSSEIRKNLTQP